MVQHRERQRAKRVFSGCEETPPGVETPLSQGGAPGEKICALIQNPQDMGRSDRQEMSLAPKRSVALGSEPVTPCLFKCDITVVICPDRTCCPSGTEMFGS